MSNGAHFGAKSKMAPNIRNGAKSRILVEIFKINKKAAETVPPTSQSNLSGYRAPASPTIHLALSPPVFSSRNKMMKLTPEQWAKTLPLLSRRKNGTTNWSSWSFKVSNVLRAMEAENIFNVVVYDINGNDLYSNVLRTSTERKSLLQLDDLNDIECACAGIYSESGEIVVSLDTVEAKKKHKQKMNTVYSLIINRVHDDLVNTVQNKPKFPQIAWSALSELFEPSDARSVYELHKKLKGLDHKDYDTYELLVNDIITINTRLTEQGEKLSDTLLISAMLDAYRKYSEFETQITLVEALPKPTFKQAVDHFKSIMPQDKADAKDKKGNGSNGSSAKDDAATNGQSVLSMFERKFNKFTRKITKRMNKQGNNNNESNGQKNKRSKKELVKKPKIGQSIPFFNFDCNYCGRYGHRARDCPWKPKEDNNTSKGTHSSINEVPDVDNVERGEVEIEIKYKDKDIVDDILQESEESE